MSGRGYPHGSRPGAHNVSGGVWNVVNQNGASSGIQFGPNNVMNVSDPAPRERRSKGDGRSPKVKTPKKPLSKSERVPSLDQMDKICQSIDKYKADAWKELALKLGLTQGEVETVEHDYCRSGTYEMCYQMLRKWKESQPTPPQIKVLAQALCDIGRGDLSDTLAY